MFNTTFKIVYFFEVLLITIIRSIYTVGKAQKTIKSSIPSRIDNLFMIFEVIGMLIPFVYIFSPILDFANYQVDYWVGWIGAALFLLAILLLWRSHYDLGKYWVMDLSITKEHKLINKGIYKHIRHPLYASHMVWAVAQVMMLNNWISGFSFIIIFLPHYLYRVGKEEEMMISEFGSSYTNYMQKTGRLFPKLFKNKKLK